MILGSHAKCGRSQRFDTVTVVSSNASPNSYVVRVKMSRIIVTTILYFVIS